MEIKSVIKNKGKTFDVIYREKDPLVDLGGKILQGVHSYCFYKNKLVIVFFKEKGHWTLPGGGIEKGESFEEATIREVKEEGNMKVLDYKFIGYQDIYESDKVVRQVRSFCAVEPYGDFVSDPDGDITEIKLIDPKDYKKYFDWGIIGDHLMNRALEMNKFKN